MYMYSATFITSVVHVVPTALVAAEINGIETGVITGAGAPLLILV